MSKYYFSIFDLSSSNELSRLSEANIQAVKPGKLKKNHKNKQKLNNQTMKSVEKEKEEQIGKTNEISGTHRE